MDRDEDDLFTKFYNCEGLVVRQRMARRHSVVSILTGNVRDLCDAGKPG